MERNISCTREFEMVKRKVKIDDNSKITIRIPASFLEVFRAVYGCTTITEAIDSSSYRRQVSVMRDTSYKPTVYNGSLHLVGL
jgi:hypothetical protein